MTTEEEKSNKVAMRNYIRTRLRNLNVARENAIKQKDSDWKKELGFRIDEAKKYRDFLTTKFRWED